MVNVEFGVKTGQGGYSYDDLRKVWTAAEDLGYDSAWLYDHFYALGNKNDQCLEGWTTLAALASETKRLKIGTMVTSVSYRQPSLLAKMATTVDIISKGRMILGIGAGWYEEEYRAYGYEYPDQATRVRQLKEALIVIRKLWTEERATFKGKFYSTHEAINMPKPVQKPSPKILIGITRGKKTLPYLAVRFADGFNLVAGSVEECAAILESIRNYCLKFGKNLENLISSWQGFIMIAQSESELNKIIEASARERGQSIAEFRKTAEERHFIIGKPDQCVEKLRRFKDIGINHFILIFSDDTSLRPLGVFRDHVIPELK